LDLSTVKSKDVLLLGWWGGWWQKRLDFDGDEKGFKGLGGFDDGKGLN
tara:strand:- start:132 stop:275 length:144 start_codon:yes stop_codon:yes gene_type:complete